MHEPPGSTRDIVDRGVEGRAGTMSHDFVVLSDAGVLASGSGKWYTPVTVGDGGRHAGASRGAEVVARFESARVEPLDSVSGGDDPRVSRNRLNSFVSNYTCHGPLSSVGNSLM